MDQMGEISLALDLYADEASLVDPERKHTLIIRARSRRIKKELEELFFGTLMWDNQCRPAIRYLCKFGDCPYEVVPTRNRDGVAALRHMNVYNFTRIESKYGDLVGFFYQDEVLPEPVFLHPWQTMHLRLSSLENVFAPYGRCCSLRAKVLTTSGYRELGDIRPGAIVYSFNGITRQPTRVMAMVNSGVKPGIRIRTPYRTLEVSDDHPVLAVLEGAGGLFRRYVPAKHIVPGSKIIVHDPEHDDADSYMTEEVIKQQEIGELEVGDIQVDSGYHNFLADGVVVHNSILDGGRKAFKQLRLMEDAALIYRICLRGDQLIWTPTGHKPIKDIKIGDEVYCFKDGRPKTTKVVNWMCNGRDVIYRITSLHREIYANATHPILVETSYANKRKGDRPARLEYVDVKDLIVKRNGVASHHRFILPMTDHQRRATLVPCPELPSLPVVVDETFARWFGFMIGDGFVSERPNGHGSVIRQVGFALGDDAQINERYRLLFSAYDGDVRLGGQDDERLGCYYVYSKPLTEFLLNNGFIPGAENKRIPAWVYQSPRPVQEAFIDGYIDADGWRRTHVGGITEGCEVECCNEALVRDLKELCHRLGWDVGLVRKRERTNGHIINKRTGRTMPATTGWCLYFTKAQGSVEQLIVPAGERSSGYSEAILAVEECGEDLVYDVTIEDEVHNVICNGSPVSQTRAPDKRKFKIPVGSIPPKEVPEYMEMIARKFKRQRFYNPQTGTFDERYSPLIQEDDFFLPVRSDGQGPDVEVLQGAQNLDDIKDIEYFKKKMVAPMKIPFDRVGIGQDSGKGSDKSLSSTCTEFAHAVQWVQREVVTGLTKIAIIHLALRGYSIKDIKNFELALTASSAIEDLYRMETWQTRTQVMADLKDLGWFPKEWIVTHFTDLTPDEIEELKEMERIAADGGESGGKEEGKGGGLGGLGGGAPGGADLGGDGLDQEDALGSDATKGADGEGGLDDKPPKDDDGGLDEGGHRTGPHIDAGAERRLLSELRNQQRRDDANRILTKWSDRLGRQERSPVVSPFDYLIEQKELDGLSTDQPPPEVSGTPYDPNGDPGLLVEWSVPADVRGQVIKEVMPLMVITTDQLGSHDNVDSVDVDPGGVGSGGEGQDVITEDDLP